MTLGRMEVKAEGGIGDGAVANAPEATAEGGVGTAAQAEVATELPDRQR
mgnify:FL=1